MNELIVAVPLCEDCGHELSSESGQCLACESRSGLACERRSGPVVVGREIGTVTRRTQGCLLPPSLERRWVVLAILLCAGPIGLPLVWLNSRFSRFSKIGVTVGFALVTVILPIVLVWYWCEAAIRPIVDVLAG